MAISDEMTTFSRIEGRHEPDTGPVPEWTCRLYEVESSGDFALKQVEIGSVRVFTATEIDLDSLQGRWRGRREGPCADGERRHGIGV